MTEKTVRLTEDDIELLTALLFVHRHAVNTRKITLVTSEDIDERIEQVDTMLAKLGDAW